MQTQKKTLALLLMMMFASLAANATETNPSKVPATTDIAISQQTTNEKPTDNGVNPFTGESKTYEKKAAELAIAKQKRSIAEQELAETQARVQIAKLNREKDSPSGALGVLTPTQLGMINNNAGRPNSVAGVNASDPQMAGIAKPKTMTRRNQGLPANNNLIAPMNGPALIGVSESSGKKFALFEQNGKSVTVPENGSQNGIVVGSISGRSVMVNGVMQTLQVGPQEVADSEMNVATVSPIPVSNNGRPGTVARDINALQLPTLPTGPLTGPQQFRN
jgi:hypothetical protein